MQPNQQALKSFETQTLDHPADIRPQALANPFIHTLARIDGGDLCADAAEKLQKLVSNCMVFNKGGKLTIEIGMKPGLRDVMELTAKVTAKIPEGEPASTALFATPDGQLTAWDPKQPQFQQPTMPAVEPPTMRVIPIAEKTTRVIDVIDTTTAKTSVAAA